MTEVTLRSDFTAQCRQRSPPDLPENTQNTLIYRKNKFRRQGTTVSVRDHPVDVEPLSEELTPRLRRGKPSNQQMLSKAAGKINFAGQNANKSPLPGKLTRPPTTPPATEGQTEPPGNNKNHREPSEKTIAKRK